MNRTKKIIIFLSIVLVVVIGVTSVKIYNTHTYQKEKKIVRMSYMLPDKKVSDLILDSDLIIQGTVKEFLESKWSNPEFIRGKEIQNILQTDLIIKVDNTLFGDTDKDFVTVRINKGEDEKTVVFSDEVPDFTLGENVLVFLARDDSKLATKEDYYIVAGFSQGKYSMDLKVKESDGNYKKIYINQKGMINIEDLKLQIPEVKASNPNYKEERLKKQKETEEKNKTLFGE